MPWMVPAAIIGSSVIGGLSAGKASDQQAAGTGAAVDETRREFDTSRADLAPYREAGAAALSRLRSLLGVDSDPTQSPLLRKFTTEDLNSDPVYKSGMDFGLSEGEKALERRQSATGSYDSGAALKELTRFGNDYGSMKAGDSRARFVEDQNNTFGKLSGITGMGVGATNIGVGANSNTASNLSSLYTGGANAAGAATIAGGNALSGGANALANYYGQQNLLAQLTGGGGRTLKSNANLTGASDLVGAGDNG